MLIPIKPWLLKWNYRRPKFQTEISGQMRFNESTVKVKDINIRTKDHKNDQKHFKTKKLKSLIIIARSAKFQPTFRIIIHKEISREITLLLNC